jgi:hypothetical protein
VIDRLAESTITAFRSNIDRVIEAWRIAGPVLPSADRFDRCRRQTSRHQSLPESGIPRLQIFAARKAPVADLPVVPFSRWKRMHLRRIGGSGWHHRKVTASNQPLPLCIGGRPSEHPQVAVTQPAQVLGKVEWSGTVVAGHDGEPAQARLKNSS